MGSDYFFYTETRVDGVWHCIDPKIIHFPGHGRTEITWPINYTYWNGSRSYFSDTYDVLRDIGRPITFDELSEELRTEMTSGWLGDGEDEMRSYYDSVLMVCSLAKLRSINPKNSKEFHGLYHKDKVAAFEAGEMEDLYEEDISPEEYAMLPEEARKVYQYYEWNDSMSWRRYIPIVLERVLRRVEEFEDVNFCDCDDVRIIFFQSC